MNQFTITCGDRKILKKVFRNIIYYKNCYKNYVNGLKIFDYGEFDITLDEIKTTTYLPCAKILYKNITYILENIELTDEKITFESNSPEFIINELIGELFCANFYFPKVSISKTINIFKI